LASIKPPSIPKPNELRPFPTQKTITYPVKGYVSGIATHKEYVLGAGKELKVFEIDSSREVFSLKIL